MTNEEKASLYDQLLKEHDEKARQVSILQNKFDITQKEKNEIKQIKKEMLLLQKKASNLGSL